MYILDFGIYGMVMVHIVCFLDFVKEIPYTIYCPNKAIPYTSKIKFMTLSYTLHL